jgi:hypothetical protein
MMAKTLTRATTLARGTRFKFGSTAGAADRGGLCSVIGKTLAAASMLHRVGTQSREKRVVRSYAFWTMRCDAQIFQQCVCLFPGH